MKLEVYNTKTTQKGIVYYDNWRMVPETPDEAATLHAKGDYRLGLPGCRTTAATSDELLHLMQKVSNMEPLEHVHSSGGILKTHTCLVPLQVSKEAEGYFEPMAAAVQRWFLKEISFAGKKGGALDITEFFDSPLITSALIQDEEYVFVGYAVEYGIEEKIGIGKTLRKFRDHCIEGLSEVVIEREFVPTSRGLYRRNPNYATGRYNPPAPRLPQHGSPVSNKLFSYLFEFALNQVGTARQKEVYSKIMAPGKQYNEGAKITARDYTIYYADPNGTCNWDTKGTKVSCASADDFKEMV